ncbi:putative homeobox transcription factor [Tieghemostelium lacteum]|uniref:Putative homeobox transcription factor n=1 Tax=Tieghemostelium lacteum TaxID=361077 RepID=A0A152A816_TIELA|nr:putative homeobox transcription factor [Tieghemostelium lacteum]|eukprot:KYR02344.1 putative homeobox transcription factor [Tieghemostelium lacteum]
MSNELDHDWSLENYLIHSSHSLHYESFLFNSNDEDKQVPFSISAIPPGTMYIHSTNQQLPSSTLTSPIPSEYSPCEEKENQSSDENSDDQSSDIESTDSFTETEDDQHSDDTLSTTSSSDISYISDQSDYEDDEEENVEDKSKEVEMSVTQSPFSEIESKTNHYEDESVPIEIQSPLKTSVDQQRQNEKTFFHPDYYKSIDKALEGIKNKLQLANRLLGKDKLERLKVVLNDVFLRFIKKTNTTKHDYTNDYFQPSISEYIKLEKLDLSIPMVYYNYMKYVPSFENEVHSLTKIYYESDQILKLFHSVCLDAFYKEPMEFSTSSTSKNSQGKNDTLKSHSTISSTYYHHQFKYIYSNFFMMIAHQKLRAMEFIYENKKYNQPVDPDIPKTRRTLNDDQNNYILEIYKRDAEHPYPDYNLKIIISCYCDLSKYQLSNWLSNKRSRDKNKRIKQLNSSKSSSSKSRSKTKSKSKSKTIPEYDSSDDDDEMDNSEVDDDFEFTPSKKSHFLQYYSDSSDD